MDSKLILALERKPRSVSAWKKAKIQPRKSRGLKRISRCMNISALAGNDSEESDVLPGNLEPHAALQPLKFDWAKVCP